MFAVVGNAHGLMPDPFLDEFPVADSGSKTVEEGNAAINKVFTAIQKQISPEFVKNVQSVYLFKIKGTTFSSTENCFFVS